MRKLLIIAYITALALSLVSGCGDDETALQLRQYGFLHFKVTIEQDGLAKQIENNHVVLDKKPFTLRVTFIENDSIFVNASFGSSAYDAAAAGRPIDDVPGFGDAAIAEEPFNRDEVLNVSVKVPNFWYYAGEGEHRFSTVYKSGGLLTCDRVVSKIKDADTGGEAVEIAKLKQGGLFLVFAQLAWNDDYTKKIEYKRDYISITFADSK